MSTLEGDYRHKLSVSQLELLDKCPRKYYGSYILKHKSPATENTMRGTMMHALVEQAYGAILRGDKITIEWIKNKIIEGEEEVNRPLAKAVLDKHINLFLSFLHKAIDYKLIPELKRSKAMEWLFEVKMGVQNFLTVGKKVFDFIGLIDLVKPPKKAKDPLIIKDVKTRKAEGPAIRYRTPRETDLQLLTYAKVSAEALELDRDHPVEISHINMYMDSGHVAEDKAVVTVGEASDFVNTYLAGKVNLLDKVWSADDIESIPGDNTQCHAYNEVCHLASICSMYKKKERRW